MSRSPRSLRWTVLDAALIAALLHAASCTLTDGSFTPTEIDALTPDAGPLPADAPREVVASPEPVSSEPVSSDPAPAEPMTPSEPDAGASNACQGAEQQAGCPLLQSPPPAAAASPECVGNADCASLHCEGGACIPASCTDGISNQGESGVDCAGPCSARCPEGGGCAAGEDCADGLFCSESARLCTRASCVDDARNGNESATDCGGSCPPCPVGTACGANADCATGVCRAGVCAAPSCNDGLLNQNESAADCGGRCDPCTPGRACRADDDCDSDVCDNRGCAQGIARCCQPPRCNDGVRNGSEPFIDCGNAQCGACPIGSQCARNADCDSGLCQGGTCRVQPCEDRQRNGTETDVDCGGTAAACARCALGQLCQVAQDCGAGASCLGGRCANCGNSQRDGTETDVDCGGVCGACGPGQACDLDTECDRGVCQDGRCCGGNGADCTRCARALAGTVSCETNAGANAAQCNAFLQCLADNPGACPTRLTADCSDAGAVCDAARFGGNGSPGVVVADSIIGTSQCLF